MAKDGLANYLLSLAATLLLIALSLWLGRAFAIWPHRPKEQGSVDQG